MSRGRIIKALSGFYYVESSDGRVISCRGRGILKNKDISIYVGDYVKYEELADEDGVINEVIDRRNSFIRPPVANVDTMVIVASATVPKANPNIIDKFIVMALQSEAKPVLCINKADKGTEKTIDMLKDIYEHVCPIAVVSSKNKTGFDELRSIIKGGSVALAGPSGVGKSTIISILSNRDDLETGILSEKTKRGRHTTRHVEIFHIDKDTVIYDTPGFSSFDIMDIDKHELRDYYDEIHHFGEGCKYQNCLHRNEPECAVKDALSRGLIKSSRYESYLYNLNDIEEKEKRRY